MVQTLRELKKRMTILLIEHDMEAVFALADRITVLVYGRVIATGAPQQVRANPEVIGRPISASRRRWAAMADASLLEVTDVETRYGLQPGPVRTSLSIAPGEMVTLMGRNGMGKTTTVRSIMGLTPARAGTIRFAGEEIRGRRPIAWRSSASVSCRKAGRFSRI